MKIEDLLPEQDLTTLTARKKGYQWVLDVTTILPMELQTHFCKLILEEGYKLGEAQYCFDEKDRGLYEPLQASLEKLDDFSS